MQCMWRAGVLALFACAGCNQVFGLGQTVALDAAIPPGGACGSDGTCPGAEVCETVSGTCVACTVADSSACTNQTPLCGADHACHACVAHADCVSDVCLPDGSCGDAATVAYVSATQGIDPASGTPVCAQSAPCATLAVALTASKPTIKVRGSINGSTVIGNGANVTIVGDDDAELHGTGGPTIDVGPMATVTLRDLAISNGDPGVQMAGANSTANVTILHSRISSNISAGVVLSPSGAAAHQILTISQSRIEHNPAGGISANAVTAGAPTFHVIGNVFFANGNTSTSIGGASLTSTRADNTLDFNTVAKNVTASGFEPGLQCNASLVASNNIIADNSAGSAAAPSQTDGTCTYSYTLAFPGTVPGAMNMSGEPVFASENAGDLHLLPSSLGVTAANPDANLMGLAAADLDGTPRHAPASVGAFQFH